MNPHFATICVAKYIFSTFLWKQFVPIKVLIKNFTVIDVFLLSCPKNHLIPLFKNRDKNERIIIYF